MLSRRVSGLRPSGIRRIFELVASMDDPINLSIGQAHFEVPEVLKEAAIKAIRDGHNRYTITQGLPSLNKRVQARLAQRYGFEGKHSLITSGVSGGLMLGFMGLLDPGDHVLLPDPYFVMYGMLAELVSATWGTYDAAPGTPLTEEALEAGVTERTRLLLVNSPSNPTGRTLTAAELDAVGAVAARHNLVVVSDEIYEDFVYDGPHVSAIGHVDPERLLVLGGYSKTWAMPGWRMGWAAGPEPLIDAMKLMQQFSFVCAPSMAQHACLDAFELDMSSFVADYKAKRDRLLEALSPHYEIVPPGGSFYMWPRLPAGMLGSGPFMERAIARKLLVVPGNAFSASDTHVRLSFAAEDAVLERGVTELLALADEAPGLGGASDAAAG